MYVSIALSRTADNHGLHARSMRDPMIEPTLSCIGRAAPIQLLLLLLLMLKRLQWGATCAADATTSQYRVRYGSYLLFISRRAAHVMRPHVRLRVCMVS